MKTILTVIIYAGIIQGIYMAFILNHNKKLNLANKYLAILLSLMSLTIAHSVFVIPEIHKTLDNPYRIHEPFLMLVIPFIWLYIKKLEDPDFRFSSKMLLHFLPFIIFMSVNIPAFMHGPDSVWAELLIRNSLLFNGTLWIVLLGQYSVYLFHILKIIQKVRIRSQHELSNIDHADVAWLKTFLIAFIVVFVLLAVIFAGSVHGFGGEWLNQLAPVVFSLSIFILGYKGMFQKSVFSDDDVQEKILNPRIIDKAQTDYLQDYMSTRYSHRDPELTLTSLAKQLNISRNQLSEVINTGMRSNFYDFVNKYRVEDVKKLMEDPKNRNYTLLAIAYEAGFPSKSTFNAVFKKFTGLTPSGYRKRLS